MVLATTLGSPIATAASKTARKTAKHTASAAGPCHCNGKPYHGAPKHGGWLNTALPGDKSTITNARRIKNPFDGGRFFAVSKNTPLLAGNGTGQVRGWVLGTVQSEGKGAKAKKKSMRHKVQVDWGQQKLMPPPNLTGGPAPASKAVLYYYVFAVVMQTADSPPPATGLPKPTYPAAGQAIHGRAASGWIPASCLVGKTADKKKKLAQLMHCCGECMSLFDKSPRRTRFTHARPAQPTHVVAATKPSIAKLFEHRYFTHAHEGNGSHYLSRSPDKVSAAGYVNLCYNLPDLTENKINVGGVSCDTIAVGTPFYAIAKAGHVDVKLCNFKDVYKFKQRYVFGAVPYIESTLPPKTAYRYGWIAKRSIRSVP